MIAILNRIRTAGGSISVLDGKLRIEAPAGLLTDQDRQVLAQHKQDLLRLFAPAEPVVVDPYLDQEREAIRWVEALSPAEAEAVVAQGCLELGEIVAQDQGPEAKQVVHDGQDRVLEPDRFLAVEFVDLDDWLRENTVEPIVCDKCGSLDQWQDCGGSWHCAKCDPPIRSQLLRQKAERLRRQPARRHHASLH